MMILTKSFFSQFLYIFQMLVWLVKFSSLELARLRIHSQLKNLVNYQQRRIYERVDVYRGHIN